MCTAVQVLLSIFAFPSEEMKARVSQSLHLISASHSSTPSHLSIPLLILQVNEDSAEASEKTPSPNHTVQLHSCWAS